MNIICPFGYVDKISVGRVAFEYTDVNIFGNVCSHADLCGNKACKFWDVSEQGTRRFMEAMKKAKSSIEGLMDDKRKEAHFQKRMELGLRVIKGGK